MNDNVKYLFVLNPKSFWHKQKLDQVIARIDTFFRSGGNNDYVIHVSRFPRDAVCFIPLFAGNFPENTTLRVIAVGGDGILFDCLNGVMAINNRNVNAELGAMPYGQTNNFIRGFGKNGKFQFRELSLLYNAGAIPIDVMRCGNNYALGYCFAGIEAGAVRSACKTRELMMKGNPFNRWLCMSLYRLFYLTGGLAACGDKRQRQQYEGQVDGESTGMKHRGFAVFNSPFFNENFCSVKGAMPGDGFLDMVFFRYQGLFRAMCTYPFYLAGRHEKFPGVFLYRKGRKAVISSGDPMLIAIDGIVFFETEIEIELLPSALRFIDTAGRGYRGAANG
ncbi:MAG: hypothetical protein FWH38_02555 [Treponema sp.]|nr:hypothetical protein [Treponema sp.]